MILITIVTAKNIPGLLEYTLLMWMPIDSGARYAISTLVRYVITIIGLSVAAGMLGLSWQSIQWMAAALTFGLAFGLQEIFANFVSGLIILLERTIRVGDPVTIENLSGRVTRIQMRSTTIMLWDGSEMIVPNKEFITGKLVNWTLSDPRTRVDIPVGVAYGSDVEKVKELLLKVAREHPAVLADPEPQALFLEFGDSALKFELRVFIFFDYGRPTAQDELHTAIDKLFREHGVVIAFPQVDVHVQPAATKEAGASSGEEASSPAEVGGPGLAVPPAPVER